MFLQTQDGVLSLQGALTMANVNEAQFRLFVDAVAEPSVHTVDLTALQRADSACVAWLLAALRTKKHQQRPIRFVGMSSDLRLLTSLYDIDGWIEESEAA